MPLLKWILKTLNDINWSVESQPSEIKSVLSLLNTENLKNIYLSRKILYFRDNNQLNGKDPKSTKYEISDSKYNFFLF